MGKGKPGDEKMADELSELDEFEEIEKVGMKANSNSTGAEGKSERPKGNRPDFRVLQPDTDANGQSTLRSVGAMWRSTTKNGQEYFVLKIGELRLLVFPNTNR